MQQLFQRSLILLTSLLISISGALGQDPFSFNLKKPEKYENKTLGSEKSAEKKFTAPRRFIQNNVTHYNWYYNANNKLNEVLERAKSVHQDDFSQLLPFYNYSLETTIRDSVELDSVIFKSNTGILIHDLRNAWIDNLFMLMGKAYFFKKQLDSAYVTFQFINYAFSPKEDDGYQKPIGSNATEGGNAFNVATKENSSLVKRVMSTPPSRNDALIWQVKTFLENDELASAAALIEVLRLDPQFPERLHGDLNEVRALMHYKMNSYDSAAFYLQHALGNAGNKTELSRWEYLIAQLYERAGKTAAAQEYYEKAIKHTLDPVLEVYARLNSIRQNKGDSSAITRNIEELVKMGRKDRYSKYRDIIYFTAAQIELERKNIPAARALLLKSTQNIDPERNTGQRGKAFMLLGDLAYASRDYSEAKRFYDSVSSGDPAIVDPEGFIKKNDLLALIVQQQDVIYRQDSLQRLAALPEAEREAIIRKKLRALRKAQGLKEEEVSSLNPGAMPGVNRDEPPTDLFGGQEKGEWYFYNQNLKSKGYSSFKAKWGSRPNVDNWRRISSVNAAKAGEAFDPQLLADGRGVEGAANELSYEAMLKNLPQTPDQLARSNDSIMNARLALGGLFMNGIEDYNTVITTLEPFPTAYANSDKLPEALYYLYYSYKHLGEDAKAQAVLRYLQEKYAGNLFERRISNAVNKNEVSDSKSLMTRKYDEIYNLFIEGRFERALAEKKLADSTYGESYWTPQLLYIESIYHIRQRNDAQAKLVLEQLINMYPESAMKEKAITMLDVLVRRKEIEDYLTNLKIERPKDDEIVILEDKPASKQQPKATPEEPQKTAPVVQAPVKDAAPAKVVSKEPANQQQTPAVVKSKDSVAINKPAPLARAYTLTPEAPHHVVIVTENVDPVYVNESRNAFNRYNQVNFYNKKIDITNIALSDSIKLVVMSGFANAEEALQYADKTSKIAATQIVPWLPAAKYSFILISESNLEVLKTLQSVPEYRKFLEKHYPGKF